MRLSCYSHFLETWIDVVAGIAVYFPKVPIKEIYRSISGAQCGQWYLMARNFGVNKKMIKTNLRECLLERYKMTKRLPIYVQIWAMARVTFYVWRSNRKSNRTVRCVFREEVTSQ